MPAFFIKWIMYLGKWLIEVSKKITADWAKTVVDSTVDNEKQSVTDFIKSQWKRGENKYGEAAGYYTAYTERMAATETTVLPKVQGDPYNFLWSGDLFANILVSLDGGALLVDSSGRNKAKLFERISENSLISNPYSIFGLQDENKKKLYDQINFGLISKVLTDLNLKK